jgi:creatinine amidohydrolase
MTAGVLWEELLPDEFLERLRDRPLVWLPMGLCEPHGHVAPFGLDTIKARYLCEEGARRFGGVVAPALAYHVHETGYHGPWLRRVMGEVNPRLAALPPHVVYEAFLYLLRAFRNAGFKAAIVISGHSGGNQHDLRRVAQAFDMTCGFETFVCSDPELVANHHSADHAGRYEISQLLAIRPDLVALHRAGRADSDLLGRFAQNPDAAVATGELGQAILEASLAELERVVVGFGFQAATDEFIPMEHMGPIWAQLLADKMAWRVLDT